MMCTIVIRDVVGVLIFDIVALLIRGAETFVGNDSSNFKLEKNMKRKKQLHQFQAARKKITEIMMVGFMVWKITHEIVEHALENHLCMIRQSWIIHSNRIRAITLNHLIEWLRLFSMFRRHIRRPVR